MADPVTMAAVSIGSTVVGGIFGAQGAADSASASAQSWNYKAGIADLNATINKQNASWALNAGDIKASEVGMKAGQDIAETKVKQAAGNLDTTSGSAAAVRDTQTDVARFEQGIVRADAAHTAYGYESKAAADTAEAGMDRASAENARKAGQTNILSSILGTVSSVASKWSQANTIGIGSQAAGPIGTFDPDNFGAQPSWSTG